ncbi:hypothetical protein FBU59_000586 [Linderina macrospora]|uniref:Uncharacterized protein n=1 Tax=Linderina macrospora TaxID=4868 RepID=A0ACC1JGG6_9FUNG|nr:hypothetical protein FBU59_000586 [Linderina macrospora]
MATNFGLRSNTLRGPLLRSVASSLRAPTMTSVRHHSHPRQEHFVANEFGLLSNYVPAPWSKRSLPLSREGLSSTKTDIVEALREVFSLATMKWYLSGWKGAEFAQQAEELYGLMNEAFAKGDLKSLNTICFPNMYANLKNEIKRRKVNFDWKKAASVSPPKVVQIRTGRITSDFAVGQVVVRIDQEQLVTPLTRRPAVAAGSKSAKPVHVREYIVLQRVITDQNAPWAIYGKLSVPEWDAISAQK